MKLYKLHIGHPAFCPVNHSHAIAGSYGRIGSAFIYLPGTSGSYIYTPILAPILNSNITDSDDGDKNINLRITGNDRPVGSLVYNSGLMVTGGVLPAQDTPNTGDLFLLYAKNSGNVFEVAVDNLWSPSNFYLALAQNLFHLGPYVSVGENIYALDDGTVTGATRVNEDCDSGKKVCGSVPSNQFFASSVVGDTVRNVPEPASLILVGLGLVGIALVRRRQQPG